MELPRHAVTLPPDISKAIRVAHPMAIVSFDRRGWWLFRTYQGYVSCACGWKRAEPLVLHEEMIIPNRAVVEISFENHLMTEAKKLGWRDL